MSEFFQSNGLDHQDLDKQNQAYIELIENLLADNNLMRKKLPEERNSLLKAVSDALYFTPRFFEDIQQYLIKHLKNLISLNKLPSKLNMFKGNSILLKDFTMSPHLPGFEKINLELVSSAFKVRVIIYGVTEDSYLSSLIINSKFKNTIELLRTKNNHYDPVYSTDYMERAGKCQNIVLNIIEQALNGKTAIQKDFNKDTYINFEYNNWIASKQAQNGLEQFKITRGRHKKSFSDNFNKSHEVMEEQQMKIYNMFMNMKPPEDFLDKINLRKDTVDSNFSINANLDFVDEAWQDTPPANQEYAIKNYPITSSGLSSTRNSYRDLRAASPQPQRNPVVPQNNMYFRENLSLAEIERLERSPLKDNSGISPMYYVNADPPGLTPTSYAQQKAYNFSDSIPTPTGALENSSPTFKSRDNLPHLSYSHSVIDSQSQANFGLNYQPLNSQSQAFSNPYLKRAESERGLPMSLASNPYSLNHQHMLQYGQQQIPQNFIPGNNKKKPLVIDDSNRRYTGRLKFFDETKNYGFIIMDEDGSDIFVHYDDLAKANLNKDLLRTAKAGNLIKVSFSCMQYIGKYNKSRKAVEVQLVM